MPEGTIICNLWSFADECDIPNWVGLVIEGMIGGTIAFFFYWIQKRKAKRRETHTLKKLSAHIIDMEDFNRQTGETITQYYNKNASKEDFLHDLEHMRDFCKEIRFDLTIFSQDTNEKLVEEFDMLLSSIEEPLPFMEAQWRDEGFINYNQYEINKIKEITNSYDPKYVKNAREHRDKSMVELAMVSKYVRESLENAIVGKDLPTFHNNKGTYWWD